MGGLCVAPPQASPLQPAGQQPQQPLRSAGSWSCAGDSQLRPPSSGGTGPGSPPPPEEAGRRRPAAEAGLSPGPGPRRILLSGPRGAPCPSYVVLSASHTARATALLCPG